MAAVDRPSALDLAFLDLETPQAPLHVSWTLRFGGAPPSLAALRRHLEARLHAVPRFRRRLVRPALGLGGSYWADDPGFDLARHVFAVTLSAPGGPGELREVAGALLSQPLPIDRPLWRLYLVGGAPDGFALVGQAHHALVDGIAALQIVGLVADAAPGASTEASTAWSPSGDRGPVGWALEEVTHTAGEGLRALRATAGAVAHPNASARGALRRAGRVWRAAREDILPRAPVSALNVPIGPRRSLVGYHASREEVRAARAEGGTINDIGLSVVAGALRVLAERCGDPPRAPLKAMVPVSMRRPNEGGPGNRIAMTAIELPVHLDSPQQRLQWVRARTRGLKDSGRAEGVYALMRAGALVPTRLRSPVVRLMSSPRVFNLTVSQSPAPRDALHVLGCEVDEVYSVVPIADRHALAIGMVRYRRELFFGCYADPDALPEIHDLPALLAAEMRELGAAANAGRATG
jgi:WS/DGAT/MGAT family acyltransferase